MAEYCGDCGSELAPSKLRTSDLCDWCRRRHYGRRYNQSDEQRRKQGDKRQQLRAEFIQAYGGACQCCGETEPVFLTLDHVNNDGAQHRRTTRRSGYMMIALLRELGWPKEGYQLLCFNCNAAKQWAPGGVCPHKVRGGEVVARA